MIARFMWYHLPAILWALAIFGFSSIPSSSIPNLGIFSHDKLLHAGVFFIFSFLLYRSFKAQQRFPALSRHPGVWTLGAATVYAITDEFHQIFVTGRSADFRDVLADVTGALILLGVMWIVSARRARDAHD